MPLNALVVGAPRSGTSLSAAVFARQGYHVAGETTGELRDPDRHNPFGYWEAQGLIDRNVDVFRRAGFEHHNTWMFDAITDAEVRRIRALDPHDADREFLAEYAAHAPFVWKDPRLCYTLGYWWRLMDPETTRVILVRRDHESIAKSWWGYFPDEKVDTPRALARIADHYRVAEDTLASLSIPHVAVGYEEYLVDAETVAARISVHFGLSLAAADLNVQPELDHSTGRGQLARLVERAVEKVPSSWSRRLQALTPRWLMRMLFPEREIGS